MLADSRRALRVAGLLLVGAAFLYLTVWITSTRFVLQWGDDRVLRLTSHLRASPVVSDVVAGALLGSGIALGWPALLVLWRADVTNHPLPPPT